jgi:hypothetical protein
MSKTEGELRHGIDTHCAKRLNVHSFQCWALPCTLGKIAIYGTWVKEFLLSAFSCFIGRLLATIQNWTSELIIEDFFLGLFSSHGQIIGSKCAHHYQSLQAK